MAARKRRFTALHKVADKVEPRLARAIVKSMKRIQETVSIFTLAAAISRKDVKLAMKVLFPPESTDALAPITGIVTDTVVQGGKVASRSRYNAD